MAETNRWVVVVTRGVWARCYGIFPSYDASVLWADQNQYEPGEREIYPIKPVPGAPPHAG